MRQIRETIKHAQTYFNIEETNEKVVLGLFIMLIASVFLTICYGISILMDSGISNAISLVATLVMALVLVSRAINNQPSRLQWLLLASMLVFWAFGDFLWLIQETILGLDPNDSGFVAVIYFLPNVMLMLSAVLYFIQNMRKWHYFQLLLDMGIIIFIAMILIVTLFLPKGLQDVKWTLDGLLLLSTLFTNLVVALIVLTMMSSFRLSKTSNTVKLLVTGIFLYTTTDLIYLYQLYHDSYVANGFLDYLYLLGLCFLTLAGINDGLFPSKRTFYNQMKQQNIGQTKVILGITLIPLILWSLRLLTLVHIGTIYIAVLFYHLLSHYVQKSVIIEKLYETERAFTHDLEALVQERTQALIEAHRILEAKAMVDELTGLQNRFSFLEKMSELIDKKMNIFSVIFVDIDRFKVVNDIHGHTTGDDVLKIIANRLIEKVEDVHALARVGGDDFAYLVMGDDEDALLELSQRLINAIQEPLSYQHFEFYLGATVGVARYPKDAITNDALLKSADIAMIHAKNSGKKNKVALYSKELIQRIERRNHVEWLLHNSNFRMDFELYYQPQFNAVTRELEGMEALLRWNHPQEGFISPAEFIPIAEESGMIIDISAWVFEEAMHQISRWNRDYQSNYVMGINVSPLLFDSVDLLPMLKQLIESCGIEGNTIDLEITEHSAMHVSQHSELLFKQLSQMGFSISIDDFGTGYSSLSYIRKFSVNRLKIAKELVDALEQSTDGHLIVSAIIMMARGLNLKTIAEGVETFEQLELLKRMNCDSIQGYVLGRPTTAIQFETLYLRQQATHTSI